MTVLDELSSADASRALVGTSDRAARAHASASGRRIAIFLIAVVATLQLITASRREINWDEFHFLSLVFDYERGTLSAPMQTFHVHLFGWLSGLPLNDDIDRIIVARCLMWLLHLATLFFLYQTAKSLVSADGAGWATIVYATLVFVLQHATSFRADPMITVLLMGALFALTRERLTLVILCSAALAVALAGLISIKSVFFLPLIAMLALLRLVRSDNRAHLLRDMAIALAVASAAFAGFHYWHAGSLGHAGHSVASFLPGAFRKTVAESDLFHGARYFLPAVLRNIVHWVLIAAGIVFAFLSFWKTTDRIRILTVLVFAMPLLLIAFYRNTFPYFYVFMMAPVALVAALAADRLTANFQSARILPAVLVALALAQVAAEFRRDHASQRSLVAAVREVFPEPVPYLDRCAMVPSYPHAGFLMSTWGLENYRERGEPIFAKRIAQKAPLFLIASHPALTSALEHGAAVPDGPYSLLRDDAAALKDNFVPHWGPIWVAGKHLPFTGGEPRDFDVAIPGDYTVEAEAPVVIDGATVAPGDVITLGKGEHVHQGATALLRYGRSLPRPSRIPPEVLFTGF